jgi:hypothetical protein
MNGNRHKAMAQKGQINNTSLKQSDLYVIPKSLIFDMFNSMVFVLNICKVYYITEDGRK